MSNIRFERLRRGLTQRQLAAALGIDPTNLCTIETMKRKPCKPERAKLFAYFGIPCEVLLAPYVFDIVA